MLVRELLLVTDSLVDIYTGENKYGYAPHGILGNLLNNNWEIRKYIGSIRTIEISEEEKNNVLNKEISSISSGGRAPCLIVNTK